jgi:hypothetical protein
MGAAFGGEAHAGRRRRHDEPRAGIERVQERVEPARDERVVEGAQREQRLAGEVVGDAECPQEQEEIVLGDAELDVLAPRRLAPLHRLGDPTVAEVIGTLLGEVDAAPVDPAGQMRGHRDVGRHGQDPLGRRQAGEGAEHAPERFLTGHDARVRRVEGIGQLDARARRGSRRAEERR